MRMSRWRLVGLIVLTGLAWSWDSAAVAQTTTPGAFDSLSTGNQKIARALYDAQEPESMTTQPLTLDEIAAKKQDGQGWGQVFNDMKAQGLVQEKNLGQVVSRYQRSTYGGTYSASGRPFTSGSHGANAKSPHDIGGSKHGGTYGGGSSGGRGHAYSPGSSGSKSMGGSPGGPAHGGKGGK